MILLPSFSAISLTENGGFTRQQDRRTGLFGGWNLPAKGRMEPTSTPLKSTWENVLAMFDECTVCKAFVQRTQTCLFTSPYEVDKAFDEYRRHTNSAACKKYAKSRTHKGNGVYQGAFAFTLTKSPKDPYSVGDMLIAVRKIMRQKSCPVKRFAWYYEDKGKDELGDPIHPHIHAMYETHTGGRIERKHFHRAWPLWDETKPMGAGFQGGYHRPVKSEECYTDYIQKDSGMHESDGIELTD